MYIYICTVCSNRLLQSCLTLCDPIDCSPQAPSFMGFSRQEYWSGLPSTPPGDLPDRDQTCVSKISCSDQQLDSLTLASLGKPIYLSTDGQY